MLADIDSDIFNDTLPRIYSSIFDDETQESDSDELYGSGNNNNNCDTETPMSPMISRVISDEGNDWDEWLKNALQQCFPDNWRQYLTKFKQHRITEDVLITMNTDIYNKGEVWKELLPAIGDRMSISAVNNVLIMTIIPRDS